MSDSRILPGQLVKCTYEGLPLRYPEWLDLYIVGDIPMGIWDKIRKKHEEYMAGDPDWLVEELSAITIDTLEKAGLKVFEFGMSSEFPALKSFDTHLCDFCKNMISKGDRVVEYEGGIFCTESCLFEALSLHGEVTIFSDDGVQNPKLECPHCHVKSYSISDRWGSEGVYVVQGENGFKFSVMTCPYCGGIAPLVEE